MISRGLATVYVSDMHNAVHFYTEVLALRLKWRHEHHIAMVDAGPGLTIALHPITPAAPAPPGTRGSVQLGLVVDEPIERVVARLQERGVRVTTEIVTFEGGKCVMIQDQDGTDICVWEQNFDEAELERPEPATVSAPRCPRAIRPLRRSRTSRRHQSPRRYSSWRKMMADSGLTTEARSPAGDVGDLRQQSGRRVSPRHRSAR
jgi:predicted enzyme related to lactoylglutathione lyase